jgi:hypothetical protein
MVLPFKSQTICQFLNGTSSLDHFMHEKSHKPFFLLYKKVQLSNHSISGPVLERSTTLDRCIHERSYKTFFLLYKTV